MRFCAVKQQRFIPSNLICIRYISMTSMKHVDGTNKGKVVLYALSTCVWCKKTKALLKELDVEYDYIDIDLLQGEEKERAVEEVTKWNPRCNFPTLVLNDTKVISPFKEAAILEELGD